MSYMPKTELRKLTNLHKDPGKFDIVFSKHLVSCLFVFHNVAP